MTQPHAHPDRPSYDCEHHEKLGQVMKHTGQVEERVRQAETLLDHWISISHQQDTFLLPWAMRCIECKTQKGNKHPSHCALGQVLARTQAHLERLKAAVGGTDGVQH